MLAQWYPPIIGGEEGHVQGLSHELQQRGHEVTVVTLRQPGLAPTEDDEGVRVERVDGWAQRADWLFSQPDRRSAQPFPDPGATAALRRIIGEVRPDVVHAHNWMIHSMLPLKRWSAVPLVLTLHDYSLVCAKKTLVRRGRLCSGPGLEKCLRCAGRHYGPAKGAVTTIGLWASAAFERSTVDRFVAVSTAVADGNHLQSDGLPWEVIPNFVRRVPEPRPSDELLAKLPTEPFVMFAGAFAAAKGVDVLVQAHRLLRRRVPLVLIGYPTAEDLDLGHSDGIHAFTSWPRDTVMAAWERSLVGVVPSVWRDPCPTVAMEAMLAGRPVIASAIGGLPEIIVDDESGLLVPAGDPAALAAALDRVIDDDALRHRLAAGAAQRANRFTASEVVPRVEELYERVVRGRAA
jgi:glycosyltransferase involved in cell wall biosynthesis